MKTVVIDRKSWHYRAQDFIFALSRPTDFCSYVRRVLWSLLVLTVFVGLTVVMAVGMALSLADFIGWLVAGMVHGFVMLEDGVGFAILLVASVIIASCWGAQNSWPIVTERTPDFVVDAYHALRERICYRLEIRG